MRAFVIRARAAPVDSQQFLAAVGEAAHTEILAHALMNTIFVAQSHREDVIVYLVLESTKDFSRTVCFTSSELRHIGGFHEQNLINKIAKALTVSKGMDKEQTRLVDPGITVRTISFEKLVQELALDYQLFMMNKKGTSIREQDFSGNPCFLLTDHIPMPKNSFNSLKRLGTQHISLGPTMLFASQCVVLIHNELDMRL
jgi:tRNA (pseudouridine54-N1)-methyltransferase